MNLLAREKSPYLRQHADNPVGWHPWHEDAFRKAREEDKPIFLSIGYSTCHWCHVMARESFQDEEVAAMLNDAFVCVKVDREERPDIDSIYMRTCVAVTGSGGWPLTIIMTPDGRPFFAATYLQKESGFGRAGLKQIIPMVARLWRTKRSEVIESAGSIAAALREPAFAAPRADAISPGILDRAYAEFLAAFDTAHGGFGGAPKFPSPHSLLFLLRYWKRTGNRTALEMALKTLDSMRAGGIYDQIGFGFHRYSTDAAWFVPHFEKMLYDQAMLTIAYSEAYLASGNESYARTAEEIIAYVIRALASHDGPFYSAEDADCPDGEGRFYTWTVDEVADALAGNAQDMELAAATFGIEQSGNFAPEGRDHGSENIFRLKKPLDALARDAGVATAELSGRLARVKKLLFDHRQKRRPPDRDDKILADWNGLMMAAIAIAGRALGNDGFINRGRLVADFILSNMGSSDSRIGHVLGRDNAGIGGFLDDYAFLAFGLFETYESCFEEKYLAASIRLTDYVLAHFRDSADGGFYQTADNAERLIARVKETHDGAIPSGSSIVVLNLLRLSRFTSDVSYKEAAMQAAGFLAGGLARSPMAGAMLLCALDYAFGESREIVVVGQRRDPATEQMMRAINSVYSPGNTVIFRPTDAAKPEIDAITGFTSAYGAPGPDSVAYVCRNRSCALPVTGVDQLRKALTD